jgi:hypothetical protein
LLPHKSGLVLALMGGGGDNSLGGSEGEVGRSHDDRVSDDVGSSRGGARVGNQRRGVREEAGEGGVAMVKVRVCCHSIMERDRAEVTG